MFFYTHKSLSHGLCFCRSSRPTERWLFSEEMTVSCVSRHPYLQRSTAAAEAWCLGCSTGTVCPLNLPGWAACGRAPVGRRRTESLEDRSGAGGRWGEQKKTCQRLKTWISTQNSSEPLTFFVTIRVFFCLRAMWSWYVWFCSLVAFIQTAATHRKLHENRTTHLCFTWVSLTCCLGLTGASFR